MHQRTSIFRPLVDACAEFIGQQLDHIRMSVLGRQMHRRPVLIVCNRRRGTDTVKVLDQALVTFSGGDVKGGLSIAILRVHIRSIVHQDAHHLHITAPGSEMEGCVSILCDGLSGVINVRINTWG